MTTTRRRFLMGAGACALTALLPPEISFAQRTYGEAPMLAARVDAGDLPPVNQRLPRNPLLIQPVERPGVYGGTWRMGLKRVKDTGLFARTISYDDLVAWDPAWTHVVPNVAERFAVNADATEFTFYLREGLRWSDGEPFTAADILFYFEIAPLYEFGVEVLPGWLMPGDEPASIDSPDSYTVTLRFAAPYGLFLQHLAHPSRKLAHVPRHALEKLHRDYNPQAEADALAMGFESWEIYFGAMSKPHNNPAIPTLDPWLLTDAYVRQEWDAPINELVAVRNPYYWKIDTEFQQLPYIDTVHFTVDDEAQVFIDLALAGKIDMQERHISPPDLRPQYEAHPDLELYLKTPTIQNAMVLDLNLTHPDPVRRALFQQKDFRIGLSHAINRQAIIDAAFGGVGQLYQSAPRPESPFYNEQLATQYTAYDPALAAEHLERAGLSERDADGWRLGPDGAPLTLTIELADLFDKNWPVAAEMVKADWQAAGIQVRIEVKDWEQLDESRNNSTHDVVVWTGAGGLDVILTPDAYVPVGSESGYAMRWVWWYRAHPIFEGEEPPPVVRDQQALYGELLATPDVETQNDLMQRIIAIAAEQFYSMGIALAGDGYGVHRTDFHNVPRVMPDAWVYPSPAPTHPCQYFIE